tara:strand:+ start:636 stop:2543 length:1908 start_codon:yes stop_codon:yes gene_type:complete
MRFILILVYLLIYSSLKAECSDLDSLECADWPQYCEWNVASGQCQEIGGGGDNDGFGPFEYESITESDGLTDGLDYLNGILFYPINAILPYRSIIFTPGYGGGSEDILMWSEFFASHGFIGMSIGPNDPINEWHTGRAYGLLDAIQTIKEENVRSESPIFGQIDTTNFILAGHSMGGGASQIALTIESMHHEHISGAIALNPTILIEDCDLCPDGDYCICLVPEMLEHDIPTLVIPGQYEIDELPDYDGLLGQDIYYNTTDSTIKMLYEVENGGHSSAEFPQGNVQKLALLWAKYFLSGDSSLCDSLLLPPDDASLFLTTLDCNTSEINTFQPQTKEQLQMALDLWINDNNSALETYGEINEWDISVITDLSNLFQSREYFNDDISNWDVSNVTDMSRMFYGATEFNQNIDAWDVSNVINMDGMFKLAISFNQTLSSWDVSNVFHFSGIFCAAENFNQDISSWDVSNVLSMDMMFYDAASFNQNIAAWNISNVIDMYDMFSGEIFLSDENKCFIHTSFSSNENWPYDWSSSCDVVNTISDILPNKIKIHQNFPNPFNPTTLIKYDIPNDNIVSIIIYNVMGNKVVYLMNEYRTAGYHSVAWDATDNLGRSLSAGIYIYAIQVGDFRQVKKMILLK